MRSGGNRIRVQSLTLKQKLILTFFFMEVIIYPFIVALQLEGGEFEPDPGNRIVQRGLMILFIWVPMAVILGFLIGRKVRENPEVIGFFRDRDVSPDEVAPIVGIFAPLAIVTAVLVFWLIAISLRLFFITIPIYLIIRYWKKKGIRSFINWIFRLVLRIAIRMKRISYIGYILPFIFGSWFANGIIKNAEAQSGGTLILILIQMVVLVALWKFIRKPMDHDPAPSEQPIGGPSHYPGQQPPPPGYPSVPPFEQPYGQAPAQPPQQPYPTVPFPAPQQRTLPQTPSSPYPLPTTPPLQSRPPLPTYVPWPPPGHAPPPPGQTGEIHAHQPQQQLQGQQMPSQQQAPFPQQPPAPSQTLPGYQGQPHQPRTTSGQPLRYEGQPHLPQNLGSGIPLPKKKKRLFGKK